MVVAVSVKDDFARFTLLSPEQQEWIHANNVVYNEIQLVVGIGKVYTCNEYNIQMAKSISKIFPIRIRWWKKDRFDKYWIKTNKRSATHFIITCRLRETLN